MDFPSPQHTIESTQLKITIPPGWYTTLAAVSRKHYSQLVAITDNVIPGELNTTYLGSPFLTPGIMQDPRNRFDTMVITAQSKQTSLDIKFYHSEDRSRCTTFTNLPKIAVPNNLSTAIDVHEVVAPTLSPRGTPDSVILMIFIDDSKKISPQFEGSYNSAIATIHLFKTGTADDDNDGDSVHGSVGYEESYEELDQYSIPGDESCAHQYVSSRCATPSDNYSIQEAYPVAAPQASAAVLSRSPDLKEDYTLPSSLPAAVSSVQTPTNLRRTLSPWGASATSRPAPEPSPRETGKASKGITAQPSADLARGIAWNPAPKTSTQRTERIASAQVAKNADWFPLSHTQSYTACGRPEKPQLCLALTVAASSLPLSPAPILAELPSLQASENLQESYPTPLTALTRQQVLLRSPVTPTHPKPVPCVAPLTNSRRPWYSIGKGSLKLSLPAGWTHNTFGVSFQEYQQLVTVHYSLYPDSKVYLRSTWGQTNDRFKDHYNPVLRCAVMEAQTEATTMTLDFFYSQTKTAICNIPSLQISTNRSHDLQVTAVNKPSNISKNVPDYMTLFICVSDSAAADTSSNDMVFIVNLIYKPLATDATTSGPIPPQGFIHEPNNANPAPPPPPSATEKGYHPVLDMPRPATIANYFKFYETVFLIDDSSSMAGPCWDQCIEAVVAISGAAIDMNCNGIDIYFLNSDHTFRMKNEIRGIKDKSKVKAAVDKVQPSGGTPTGERLRERLGEHLMKMDNAFRQHTYGDLKPLDLIVITDGCPNDNNLCKIELEKAAKHIKDNNYHPNHIRVQFVQVGNGGHASAMLNELVRANVNGMVDTVEYTGTFGKDDIKKILLGATHPNLRTQSMNY